MLTVQEYLKIRTAKREGMSIKAICRTYHHSHHTIKKALNHPEPRPYTRVKPWYRLGDYEWTPPEYEGAPSPQPENCWNQMYYVCIERHVGGVNSLFMDWSVRKVGLKELWTLKWHREYNTRGPWTKAGGVRPEDWPPWMRKFKDY